MKVEWRTRRESLHAKRAKRRGGGMGEEEEAAKVERCARDVVFEQTRDTRVLSQIGRAHV